MAEEKVVVRIEGRTSTIFDKKIKLENPPEKKIKTRKGGEHPCTCDGCKTTPTGCLYNAAKGGGFTFDGYYDHGFGDFLIDSINGDVGNWFIYKNYVPVQKGGCQVGVTKNDEILWAIGETTWPPTPLYLHEPEGGKTVTLTVKNKKVSGTAVEGADIFIVPKGPDRIAAAVFKARTNKEGKATITFTEAGERIAWATKYQCVRSNHVNLKIT